MSIQFDTLVVRAENHISAMLGKDAVILNATQGKYYGLNPVGARVWELIEKPAAIREILHTLLEEYEVESERCQADLFALIEQMQAAGLVELSSTTQSV